MTHQKLYRLGTVQPDVLSDVVAGESALLSADEGGLLLLVTWNDSLSADEVRAAHESLLDRARLRNVGLRSVSLRRGR